MGKHKSFMRYILMLFYPSIDLYSPCLSSPFTKNHNEKYCLLKLKYSFAHEFLIAHI